MSELLMTCGEGYMSILRVEEMRRHLQGAITATVWFIKSVFSILNMP